ncbi:unnamed protein product, partial [Sphacelaria rigidula]
QARTQSGLLSFLDNNNNRLSSWYLVATDIALIRPWSASIERVFPFLRGCLNSRREKAFGDRIESAVMIKYNQYRLFYY